MIDVPIPSQVEIGGFTYSIETSRNINMELQNKGSFGDQSHLMRRIRISTDFGDDHVQDTLLHELIHAIASAYGCDDIEEKVDKSLASGFRQIFKQLGVRFVLGVSDGQTVG